MNIKEITVTTSDLADLIDVSDKYISQLVLDHNYPKEGHNAFNLYKFIKKRFQHLEEMCNDRIVKILREETSKSRLERANAELKELELQEKRGQLIDSNHFKDALENEAHIFIKGLDILNVKLGQVLSLDEKQSQLIEKEINSIREQIAALPADTRADSVNID